MTRAYTIIFLGIINVVHALFHVIQVIQSFLLASYSLSEHKENFFTKLMESPAMGVISLIIGIITVVIGIRDYRHHQHHKD